MGTQYRMSGPKRRIAERMRQELVFRFPLCFAPKGQPKRPLKSGIHVDIIAAAPDLDQSVVRLALHDYTNGVTYLREMVEGTERIGIGGKPEGHVTVQAAEHAADSLRRIQDHNRRRAQERAAALEAAE